MALMRPPLRATGSAAPAAILDVVRANLKQFGEITDWETAALSNAIKVP
jgi:hypothetical protein